MPARIAIFGDSITHGGIDTEFGGWAARLKIWCMNNNRGDEIFALGIGGDTSSRILTRFSVEIAARQQCSAIILACGINDAQRPKPDASPEITDAAFRTNIRLLSAMSRNAGPLNSPPEVIWLGLTGYYQSAQATAPVKKRDFDPAKRRDQNDSAIQALCMECAYKYIPIADTLNREHYADGVHPTAEGHKRIFERIRDQLLEWNLLPEA